jgi:hypothetical protein
MVNLPSGHHLHHRMAGLLILTLSSMCGEGWKKAGFNYLETRSLNQDPLENTFGYSLLF